MKQQQLIQRYQQLNAEVQSAGAAMLAVSKYAPDEAVETLIDAGQMQFGESRPQNLRDRANRWPDCDWHMIGPVQKNKAKYIGRHAAMWHSCEELETARLVARYVTDRACVRGGDRACDWELPVLIQVNIATAPGQHGVAPDAVAAFAESLICIDGLRLAGLMCMAPKEGDVRQAFQTLRGLRDALFGGSLSDVGSGELSMGMSGDYRIAIETGATMVRLGSILFGDWDVRQGK